MNNSKVSVLSHPLDMLIDSAKFDYPGTIKSVLGDDEKDVSAFENLLKNIELPEDFGIEEFMPLLMQELEMRIKEGLSTGTVVKKAIFFIKYVSERSR